MRISMKSVLVTAGICGAVLIGIAYGQSRPGAGSNAPAVEDFRALLRELRPYTVASGQVDDRFQAVYVIDHEGRKLSVFRYDDSQEKLLFMASRDLGADFNAPNGGPYAETTVQLSRSRGLLYLTDNTSRRIMVYKVDAAQNTVTPLIPIDLTKQ